MPRAHKMSSKPRPAAVRADDRSQNSPCGLLRIYDNANRIDLDMHLTEEESDERCETVEKVLVGHCPPFLTVFAFSRRARLNPDTFSPVLVQEEWPFQVTIKIIKLLGQTDRVHLSSFGLWGYWEGSVVLMPVSFTILHSNTIRTKVLLPIRCWSARWVSASASSTADKLGRVTRQPIPLSSPSNPLLPLSQTCHSCYHDFEAMNQ